jgi:hypothetical protein
MLPIWFSALSGAIAIVCVYLIPREHSRRLVTVFVTGDAPKLLAAFAAVVAFGVVLYTAYQINTDLQDRVDEREDLVARKVTRDIDTLLKPAGGNIGKGDALSAMYRRDHVYIPRDLSCRTVGVWDTAKAICLWPPEFVGVDFHSERRSYRPLDSFDFGNTKFVSANFKLTSMRNFNFFHADFQGASFSGYTGANFDEAAFEDVALNTDASRASFARTTWKFVDVSGATLPENSDVLLGLGTGEVYSWADLPPYTSSKDDPDEITVPLPDDFLSKVNLCAPPMDADGRRAELVDPRRDMIGRRLYGTVQSEPWECQKMTLQQARAKFPNSFVRRHFGYWHQQVWH